MGLGERDTWNIPPHPRYKNLSPNLLQTVLKGHSEGYSTLVLFSTDASLVEFKLLRKSYHSCLPLELVWTEVDTPSRT